MPEKKEQPKEEASATVRMVHEGGAAIGSFTLKVGKIKIVVTDGAADVPLEAVEGATIAGFRPA